jgi:hypothetical protein
MEFRKEALMESPAPADRVETAFVDEVSEFEQRFDRWRRSAGLVLAPVLFAIVLTISWTGLSPEAHRLAAGLPVAGGAADLRE